ncbi:MAG: glucosamine-6-phosphate deaminase [Acetanaerobacterium sp.]
MQIHIVGINDMGRMAAELFTEMIASKPDCVLGLATGSTPLPLYRELVDRSKAGTVDFSQVRSVNLDEYMGLEPTHPQSYRLFMQQHLFDHIPIDPDNTCLPEGLSDDIPAMCKDYDARIASWGGIDLQLLGIGNNGHIGFNEPGTAFTLRTHLVQISESTRLANARFFEDDPEKVPAQAVTMGIGNIMSARRILLLVNGANKAEILYRALFEDVTPQAPASVLQLHPNVTVIADYEAAARIETMQVKML